MLIAVKEILIHPADSYPSQRGSNVYSHPADPYLSQRGSNMVLVIRQILISVKEVLMWY